jgi:carboxypeptidase Taq
MNDQLQALKTKLAEISRIQNAVALLGWDQMALMPPGGAAARGQQLAVLEQLAHEKSISPELGAILNGLQTEGGRWPTDSDEARLIAVASRDYEQAVKIPPRFSAEFAEHTAKTYEVWAKARAERNFQPVEPYLQKSLELSRQMANFFPGYRHIADPLIDRLDEGLTVATIRPLFAALRQELTPLVRAVTSRPPTDDSVLRRHFPEPRQLQFGREVAERLGYDFTRGRLDQSPHPFTTNFSVNDVRITTRVNPNHLGDCLFSVIHETGHALYEQGVNPDYEATPLAGGTSMSVHESQSRLWENLVGRSLGFWSYFYPRLQAVFSEQLQNVPLDRFYHAVNKVQPSLIRTDADELTYNLHVMIRFDLETAMLEGSLAVRDLPEAWNERYRSDLGVVPPNDALGVLQDMHWFSGTVGGYFQSYTMGNILSAQIFNAALKALPQIPAAIERGEFTTLRGWLRDHLYQYGRKFPAAELIVRVTGKPLQIDDYTHYLKLKYRALYGL